VKPEKLKLKVKSFKFLFVVFISSFLLFSLIPASRALAVSWWPIVPCGTSSTELCTRCDIFKLIKNVIDFILYGLMPPLATLLFIWGGFLILLGGANTNLVAKGKEIFKNTFFGLMILLSAWLITNTLIKSLGANDNVATEWWRFQCISAAPAQPPAIGPVITTSTLSNGFKDQSYSQSLSVRGGATPYVWSKSVGSLPSGLTLSGSTISGTPTEVGTFLFTIKVSDSSSPQLSDNQSMRIVVDSINSGSVIITTNSLPQAFQNVAYSQQLQASGGIPPYNWFPDSGIQSFPEGLLLSTAGVISGTPTTTGVFNFTIGVSDSSSPMKFATPKDLTIAVNVQGALAITTSSLNDANENQSYSSTVQATGGITPYIWSISQGLLPQGLNLISTPFTATISGTPTVAGTYNFTVEVRDSSSPQLTSTRPLSIMVVDSTLTCGQPWEQNLCQSRQMTCGASACSQYVSAINQYAGRTGVANGSNFLKAIMIKESACNVGAQSGSVPPSCGLMQLKASTANIYKNKCGITTNITCDWLKSPTNATASICIAAEYMGALTQTSCGSTPRGVAAGYNGGSGACNNSIDCAGETSCTGGAVQRWECLYDNPQQNVCNTGYAETRDYATKVLYCYNNPGF